jgi:hypothetical protein
MLRERASVLDKFLQQRKREGAASRLHTKKGIRVDTVAGRLHMTRLMPITVLHTPHFVM